MKEFGPFIVQFCLMMGVIIYLASCTVLQSEHEPVRLVCSASCDAEGNCKSEFMGSGAYVESKSEANLDTPTQTKVGMPVE